MELKSDSCRVRVEPPSPAHQRGLVRVVRVHLRSLTGAARDARKAGLSHFDVALQVRHLHRDLGVGRRCGMMSGSGMGEKCGNTVIENLPDGHLHVLVPGGTRRIDHHLHE